MFPREPDQFPTQDNPAGWIHEWLLPCWWDLANDGWWGLHSRGRQSQNRLEGKLIQSQEDRRGSDRLYQYVNVEFENWHLMYRQKDIKTHDETMYVTCFETVCLLLDGLKKMVKTPRFWRWSIYLCGRRPWPVVGGRLCGRRRRAGGPLVGGRWVWAGGRRACGRWPLAGGRWVWAGGRRAGGRWQWPVVWSGVCGRWPVVRSSPAASEGSKASAMPKGAHVQHTLGKMVSCSDITSMRWETFSVWSDRRTWTKMETFCSSANCRHVHAFQQASMPKETNVCIHKENGRPVKANLGFTTRSKEENPMFVWSADPLWPTRPHRAAPHRMLQMKQRQAAAQTGLASQRSTQGSDVWIELIILHRSLRMLKNISTFDRSQSSAIWCCERGTNDTLSTPSEQLQMVRECSGEGSGDHSAHHIERWASSLSGEVLDGPGKLRKASEVSPHSSCSKRLSQKLVGMEWKRQLRSPSEIGGSWRLKQKEYCKGG